MSVAAVWCGRLGPTYSLAQRASLAGLACCERWEHSLRFRAFSCGSCALSVFTACIPCSPRAAHGMAKRRTDSHCFAPGCRTGHLNGPNASLFAATKNDDLRKKWERNLHRKDKAFSISSAACEHHFDPQFILCDYVHVIKGNEVRISRGKQSLAPDAVPTVITGCSS
ncbi:hypothetical protein MRX96_035373 [Rhipicephalus microplus]